VVSILCDLTGSDFADDVAFVRHDCCQVGAEAERVILNWKARALESRRASLELDGRAARSTWPREIPSKTKRRPLQVALTKL
jgi:hypothetical protein